MYDLPSLKMSSKKMSKMKKSKKMKKFDQIERTFG